MFAYHENTRGYSLGTEFTQCQTDIKITFTGSGNKCHSEVTGRIKTYVMTGKGIYFPDS